MGNRLATGRSCQRTLRILKSPQCARVNWWLPATRESGRSRGRNAALKKTFLTQEQSERPNSEERDRTLHLVESFEPLLPISQLRVNGGLLERLPLLALFGSNRTVERGHGAIANHPFRGYAETSAAAACRYRSCDCHKLLAEQFRAR